MEYLLFIKWNFQQCQPNKCQAYFCGDFQNLKSQLVDCECNANFRSGFEDIIQNWIWEKLKCLIKLVKSSGHWVASTENVWRRGKSAYEKSTLPTVRRSYLVWCHQAVQVSTSISAVVRRTKMTWKKAHKQTNAQIYWEKTERDILQSLIEEPRWKETPAFLLCVNRSIMDGLKCSVYGTMTVSTIRKAIDTDYSCICFSLLEFIYLISVLPLASSNKQWQWLHHMMRHFSRSYNSCPT